MVLNLDNSLSNAAKRDNISLINKWQISYSAEGRYRISEASTTRPTDLWRGAGIG